MATNKETPEFDLGSDWDDESLCSECQLRTLSDWMDEASEQRAEKWEYKERWKSKCEEHRILKSKYKDLLTRFEELSAKVRVFVEETATDLTVKT